MNCLAELSKLPKEKVGMYRIWIWIIAFVFFGNLLVNLLVTFPYTKLVVEGVTGISIGWDRTDEERFEDLRKMYNDLHTSVSETKGKADEISSQFLFLVTDNARKAGEERKRSIAYHDEFYRNEFLPLRQQVHSLSAWMHAARSAYLRLIKTLSDQKPVRMEEFSTAQ